MDDPEWGSKSDPKIGFADRASLVHPLQDSPFHSWPSVLLWKPVAASAGCWLGCFRGTRPSAKGPFALSACVGGCRIAPSGDRWASGLATGLSADETMLRRPHPSTTRGKQPPRQIAYSCRSIPSSHAPSGHPHHLPGRILPPIHGCIS